MAVDPRTLSLIRQLLQRAGVPLATQFAGGAGGSGAGILAGLLGLAGGVRGGNPFQATGGALQAGGQLASLLGYPGVSQALGSLGGPLGMISALTQGNIGGALGALPATVAAGTGLAGSAGLGGAAAAPALAGIGSIASAAALPVALAAMIGMSGDSEGQDFFDSLFGNAKTKAQKQIEEYNKLAEEGPGLIKRRAEGAALLGQDQTPEDFLRAESGIRATNLSPWYSHMKQAPDTNPHINSARIPGQDMSQWEAIAPILEGKNWGAFVQGLDKHGAGALGFDPQMYRASTVDLVPNDAQFTNPLTGQTQGPEGVPIDPKGFTSQEAYDLSNAIAGMGQQLGIDWGSRGGDGRSQGYEVRPDQLEALGLTPGNYMKGIAEYLKSLDPNVVNNPNWGLYMGAGA